MFIYIVSLLAWLVYTLFKAQKDIHILQLNSYMPSRYLRWQGYNFFKNVDMKEVLPLLAIVLLALGSPFYSQILWIFIYLMLIMLLLLRKKREPQKKKLVYTARVKRLFVTTILIFTLCFWIFMLFIYKTPLAIYLILFISTIFSFLIILIANTVNAPIEASINRWYYNDARKIISNIPDLKVIGITGSYGKTSTKYILNSILSESFNVLMTPESYNTTMGVTITVRTMLKPTHQVLIAEMGAKKRGDVREIASLVNPEYAILTAIGEQHLETFKDLENIKMAKNELIEALPNNGMAFLNLDDKNIQDLPRTAGVKYFYYGIKSGNLHYWAEDISYDVRGSNFKVCKYDGTETIFRTKLLGLHNVYNILAATAAASELGIDLHTISYAVRKITPVPHRLELKKSAGGLSIIDDAFNSNPTGSRMALDVLDKIQAVKKILVTPGMVELGPREHEFNKEFGIKASGICDYIILVGPRQTAPIQEGLKEMDYPANQYYIARNLNEAVKHLNSITVPGSIVLFENDLLDSYNE